MALEIGKPAPPFSLPVIGGEYKEETVLSLDELKGSTVVLIFYPKDNTPGCTTQACEMRDHWDTLPDGVRILGVSADSIKSHQKFIEKQDLPYPLLSDEEKTMAEAYGVWVKKSMYGKEFYGIQRNTFIIDPEGNLQAVLEKVKPKEHYKLLMEILNP